MTMSHDQLWKDASKVLRGMLNPDLFTRWFVPVKPLELKDDTLLLGVANEFSQIWLQDNFLPLVREAVNQSSKQPVQVRFAVAPDAKPTANALTDTHMGPVRPALDIKLNPRYTFDTFVVGPNNNFSHAAAFAVAQSPGKSYNPLFIYGGVGLGKTHLMQAIGHGVAQSHKTSKICYITSEQFTNEFIQGVQTSALTKFRKKYRHIDVLLIDDIQFLA